MILNAMYPGSGNVFRDAMNVPRLLYGEDNNEDSAILLAEGNKGETQEINYGRYWHGSLVLLKPLLLFFELPDIRMFSMIAQVGLLFLIIVGFTKRNKLNTLAGFFVAIIFLNPVSMIMCFCFSVEYILMLAIMAFMLFYHEKLMEKWNYHFFFLISGILFVYFNELSFPMIGLGFPLIVYLILSEENALQLIKKEISLGIMWITGYGVMWVGKWVLAWLFTGYNYFRDAVEQAVRYTSDHATVEAEDPSFYDRLLKNISVYFKWPFALTAFAVIIVLLICVYRKRQSITRENVIGIIPFGMVALLPFGIYLVLGNGYSYVHYWFTHRLIAISIYAGICMLLQLTKTKKG
ncbi:MAG: hypothetical protein ACI4SD_09065 [Suilimivivens sp.]